jgi:hypothetical protein
VKAERAGQWRKGLRPQPAHYLEDRLMQQTVSKNKPRRVRRESHYRYLQASLEDEGRFVRRVIATLDHRGLDIAADGRPIKAGFWGLIKQRQEEAKCSRDEQEQRKLTGSSLACLDLVERAVNTITVKGSARKAQQRSRAGKLNSPDQTISSGQRFGDRRCWCRNPFPATQNPSNLSDDNENPNLCDDNENPNLCDDN